MGINIPTRQELVANNIQQDKFAEYFGKLAKRKGGGVKKSKSKYITTFLK